MITLIKRNLQIYWRNRSGVIFSLLAVIIVIFLSVIFLENNMVMSIERQTHAYNLDENNIKWLVKCWTLAGILSITPVTTSCGILGNMVKDTERKIIKDFKSSPLKHYDYPLAMVISAMIVGFSITCFLFAVYAVYISITTGHGFTVSQYGKVLLVILMICFLASTLMAYIVSFCKTTSSFSSLSTIIGTNIGFFNGIYIPLGTTPLFLRSIIQVVPFGFGASMIRDILMEQPMNVVFSKASNQMIEKFQIYFGIDYKFGDFIVPDFIGILYMGGISIISFALFMKNYNAKRENF